MRLERPKRLQSVVEFRFARAHSYWDRSGELLTLLEREFAGLATTGLEPDGFKLVGHSQGMTNAGFYWDKASIEQIAGNDAQLGAAAAKYWDIVSNAMSVSELTRIGHRTFSLYGTTRPSEAQHYLEKANIWSFREHSEGLGRPVSSGVSLLTFLPDNVRRLKLFVQAGTMTLGPTKHHGVIADTDITMEKVPPAINVREFVESNQLFLREQVDVLLEGK